MSLDLNPIVTILFRQGDLDFLGDVLKKHEPIVRCRPSERAMEIASAHMLGDDIAAAQHVAPLHGASLRLALSSWSEITHALACRYKRTQDRTVMLLFQWIHTRLWSNEHAVSALTYHAAQEKARVELDKMKKLAEKLQAEIEQRERQMRRGRA